MGLAHHVGLCGVHVAHGAGGTLWDFVWLAHQEQRQSGEVQLALDATNPDAVQEGKASWIEKAKYWLKRKRGEDAQMPKQTPKRRRKAYTWCVSLDTALGNHSGDGVLQFQPKVGKLLETPVSPDQGRDGLAALFLRYFLELNIRRGCTCPTSVYQVKLFCAQTQTNMTYVLEVGKTCHSSSRSLVLGVGVPCWLPI